MNEKNLNQLETFRKNNPQLGDCVDVLVQATEVIIQCYKNGGKVLVCGNGGSSADADHIVGELMKGFCLRRELTAEQKAKIAERYPEEADFLVRNLQRGLPAIALTNHNALMTAFINDVEASTVFAQQVLNYGRPGDVLIGLSTSGNSTNVVSAIQIANSFDVHTIGFTGAKDSKMSELCEVTVRSPQTETYLVQEDHIKLYHLMCLLIENEFFA